MTEDDLKEFLAANKEQIQSAVREKMIQGLLSNHRWEISAEISKVVEEFVTKEIVPEVRKFLADQKGPILQSALAGAATVGEQLSKAVTLRVAKRLDPNGYEFRQVLKALFD